MVATVTVNNLTVVHMTSDGKVSFMPDVCLTPQPTGPPVPIPYPNIAESMDTSLGSTTVLIDGNPIMLQGSVFSKSSGDEPGIVGGVASLVNMGQAEFINYSFDVKIEGKSVPRMGDQMLGNKGVTFNTPPANEVQPPNPAMVTEMSLSDEQNEPDRMEIKVVNRAGEPLKDIAYVLLKPDGTKEEGKSDASGLITIDDTIKGVGKIGFPELKGVILNKLEE